MVTDNSPLINKVAESGLITIDLEDHVKLGEIAVFDLKGYLFQELILKEKDFREALKQLDWEQYQDKHVAVYCSTDAIIPDWAYMLVASNLEGIASSVLLGDEQTMQLQLVKEAVANIAIDKYKDKMVMIKGCGTERVPTSAYLEITNRLRPIVKSLMYGEPCSTVPVYKRKS
ncbi:MAG: DUF2480 family protein [Bacteroidetes bacterium]|nr:DUF2480 family protein [Bacteroidota bacterium]